MLHNIKSLRTFLLSTSSAKNPAKHFNSLRNRSCISGVSFLRLTVKYTWSNKTSSIWCNSCRCFNSWVSFQNFSLLVSPRKVWKLPSVLLKSTHSHSWLLYPMILKRFYCRKIQIWIFRAKQIQLLTSRTPLMFLGHLRMIDWKLKKHLVMLLQLFQMIFGKPRRRKKNCEADISKSIKSTKFWRVLHFEILYFCLRLWGHQENLVYIE